MSERSGGDCPRDSCIMVNEDEVRDGRGSKAPMQRRWGFSGESKAWSVMEKGRNDVQGVLGGARKGTARRVGGVLSPREGQLPQMPRISWQGSDGCLRPPLSLMPSSNIKAGRGRIQARSRGWSKCLGTASTKIAWFTQCQRGWGGCEARAYCVFLISSGVKLSGPFGAAF